MGKKIKKLKKKLNEIKLMFTIIFMVFAFMLENETLISN